MFRVVGCGTLVNRKNMNAHLIEAATEHFALQSNEIIKLKQSIFNKVRNQKYNIQMQLKLYLVTNRIWLERKGVFSGK